MAVLSVANPMIVAEGAGWGGVIGRSARASGRMDGWYPARVRRPLTLNAMPVHETSAPYPHVGAVGSPAYRPRTGPVVIATGANKTVAVKIRLLRMGKIRNPQYRIVVADSRTKRDGRAIEYVGIYHPKEDPSVIKVKSERVQYWLSVGAQPSGAVQRILEKTGDWQQFKGLPAPPPLLVAPEKVSRQATYEAEAKAAAGVAETPARPAKKAAKTAAPKAAETAAPKAAETAAPKAAETAAPKAAETAAPKAAETAAAETAAPKAAEPAEPKAAEPAEPKAAEPAEPNREAVAETAEDPAGAGADAN
jgi:small subunit ribosomal protein S16